MGKPAKKAKADPVPAKSAKRGNVRILMMVCLIAMVPFSIPTLLLLFAGMLPTLVAALTDRSLARFAWICVGGLNFAGLVPSLLRLWFGHHDVSFALLQVTSLQVLLLAYGGAAAGWMIYFAAPPVVMAIMNATSKRRAEVMRQQKLALEEEWGEEVASPDEEDADDMAPQTPE